MKRNKIREHISCILYMIAFFGFLGAVTVENRGSMLDFSDLARTVMCAFSVICVIIAAIVWKAKDERGKKIKYGIMVAAIVIIIGGGAIDYFTTGGGAVEIITLKLPFEVAEVENIEMFHYDGVPVNGEKKVVTEAEDIETLYGKFHLLEVQDKKVEELTGASVTSFRFNLSNGQKFEIIYSGYGVKNGTLKIDNGATYFTMSDIGWNWEFLNQEYEAVPVQESELPGYSSVAFPMTNMEEADEHDLSVDGSLEIAEQIAGAEIFLVPMGVYTNSEKITVTNNGDEELTIYLYVFGDEVRRMSLSGNTTKTIDGLTNTHPYRIGISTENEVQVHLTVSE